MNRFALVGSASLLVLCPLAMGAVTLTSLQSNNTSACTDSGTHQSYCYQGFAGQTDTDFSPPVVYEPAPANTSGTNLTQAGTVKSGTHTTNLCTLDPNIPSGATIYVEAEGMPSIFNHLVTNPQKFTGTCS